MKYFEPLHSSWLQYVRRFVRHYATGSWETRRLLTSDAQAHLADLIERSEMAHTGEIAIAFETRLPFAYLARRIVPRDRAWRVFSKMQVWDTPQNNGVLIYFLVAERRVELVADRGLADVIPQAQWDSWVRDLNASVHGETLAQGLAHLVESLGQALAQHFPQHLSEVTQNRVSNQPKVL